MSIKKLFAVSVVLIVAALPTAKAQTTQTAQQPPVLVEIYSADDASAVLNARLAALKTVIGLKADQDKLWAPVESAIRHVTKNAADRRMERSKAAQPQDFVDIMQRTADAEAARAADLKTVATALKPLVSSLSEEQRRRIPSFLGLREGRYGVPQPSAQLWLFEDEV